MHKCNFCGNELTHVFCNLGHQPPSNSFLTKEQLGQSEVYYPLKAYVCEKCWLVQVPEVKMAKDIFSETYPYFSSQSPANVQHAKEYVDMMCERFGYNEHSKVMEIGSNDGYLLQWFKEKGCNVLGYEPSDGPYAKSVEKGIVTSPFFFGKKEANRYRNYGYDLICGINVLAHQPDINDFVEGLSIALKPDGIITMEFPHLLQLIENIQFDTIYHEHFSYFSLTTIEEIFRKHGLEIFDVDELPEHGGSLRIYAQHKETGDNPVETSVNDILSIENSHCVDKINSYTYLQYKILKIKQDFMEFVYDLNARNEIMVAYGAAAKGNTFLNYCGIKEDLISFVVDRSPHKQGLFCPGSHLPVYDEEYLKKVQPDYVLILAWNLAEEIMQKLSYIRKWGGKFVMAIPELKIA
jgi:SAM-dependent methyltransferase